MELSSDVDSKSSIKRFFSFPPAIVCFMIHVIRSSMSIGDKQKNKLSYMIIYEHLDEYKNAQKPVIRSFLMIIDNHAFLGIFD